MDDAADAGAGGADGTQISDVVYVVGSVSFHGGVGSGCFYYGRKSYLPNITNLGTGAIWDINKVTDFCQ